MLNASKWENSSVPRCPLSHEKDQIIQESANDVAEAAFTAILCDGHVSSQLISITLLFELISRNPTRIDARQVNLVG